MASKTIIIIGFMGSGKTTVGNELARQLSCRAVDLDSWITEREQRSPRDIIEQDGETAFRKIETLALREVLRDKSGISARVVALGGGAWTTPENRQLIAEQGGFAVWLDPPFELCWQRIAQEREVRPLGRSREQAQALYVARRHVYELADARIPVQESDTIQAIAATVAGVISA